MSAWLGYEAMQFDAEGKLWFCGIDTSGDYSFGYVDGDNTVALGGVHYAYDLLIDKNNVKWVATEKGLMKYDGETASFIDNTNSALPSNQVNVIGQDAQGMLWFNSGSNLVKYDGESMEIYPLSLEDGDTISALAIDGDVIWVGTTKSGLYKFSDSEFSHIYINPELATNRVTSLSDTANPCNSTIYTISGTVAPSVEKGGIYIINGEKVLK